MRRLCVRVVSGLLLSSLAAGCDRDFVEPPPTSPVSSFKSPTVHSPRRDARRVTDASPREAAHRATITRKDSEPIVVRVRYRRTRGPCVHTPDGSWIMTAMDAFDVVEVVRGHLKLTVIDVRPFPPISSGYPKNLTEGNILALRLTLSEESWKQAEENERQGTKVLIINGDEVEQVNMP